MSPPWAKDPETIEHRSFDAHVLQRCRTHGAAPIESRNGDMRFASTNSLNLCYLRFLLFKIFPVFQMGAPWAKGPQQASPGRRPGSGQEQAWSPERAAQKRCHALSGLNYLQTPNPGLCPGLACEGPSAQKRLNLDHK
jgi:hypothetical protein